MKLSCDMERDCTNPVTYIDNKGFIYCTEHGIQRRNWCPCRKLRSYELKKLRRGEQIKKY